MAKPRKNPTPLPIDDLNEIEGFDDLTLLSEEPLASEIEWPDDTETLTEEPKTEIKAEEPPPVRKIEPQVSAEPEPAEETAPAENGWYPIEGALRSGLPIRISETPNGEGTLARWKRTRAFANATHRWEATGKWEDFITGQEVSFTPKYWKTRFEE